MSSIPTVIKQPSESRLYTMEFAALLAAGESLSAVTSVTVDKVTTPVLAVSATAVSGSTLTFRLAGGLGGTRYKVTGIVTTSAGNTLEGEGIVQCEDV